MSNVCALKKSLAAAAFSAAVIVAASPAAPVTLASMDGDAVRGETAYAENCASCHADPARIMRRVSGDDDAAKAEGLDDFLGEHYAEDPEDRADIIAYLLSL